jgi:autotransporter-associated beta strand protein
VSAYGQSVFTDAILNQAINDGGISFSSGASYSVSSGRITLWSGTMTVNDPSIANTSVWIGTMGANANTTFAPGISLNLGNSSSLNTGAIFYNGIISLSSTPLISNISAYQSNSNISLATNSLQGYLLSGNLSLTGSGTYIAGLMAASNLSNITTYSTSSFNFNSTRVIDGSVIAFSSAMPFDSNPYVITSKGGILDINGQSSTISGNISDTSGTAGKLLITNTQSGSGGSIVLSGTNTYSGGTEVGAGANLSISSASNIGTGTLALIGTATTPATLTTTANMTIANPITVSGDPVFDVASGTTTTISSPITDSTPGSLPGDVVVSGGGTLALTAANTYSGLTSVDAGATLALTGAGSISTSSSLTNNGTVDVTAKTGNVVLGGSFRQASSGNLLMNISPTNNQQILVAGAASLAGGLSLNASAGTYTTGKYTLLNANGVTGTFGTFSSNLATYTRLGYALSYDTNNVYLVFTPNIADTQQSLINTASVLQNTFTLQNSVLANSFSYDCTLFDINNICISAGGRNTAVSSANGLNNTSGLLIAAYRPHANYRIGAYADQNLSVNNAGSTVTLGNNTPLIGAFGAWNESLDGTGTEIKVVAAYGQKNTTITRQVVNTSEPGSGSSQLNSQGAQITAKYGFAVMPEVIVAPYIGMRYTQNNMAGYTETASASVSSPLTYSALNTNATTALAGMGASYHFIPQAMIFASAGVESDTNTANGTYSATGLAGLTPINFNANPVKTRPTATVGAYYDVEKNQRLGITGIYRQEPFQSVSSTTVMATYTVGL